MVPWIPGVGCLAAFQGEMLPLKLKESFTRFQLAAIIDSSIHRIWRLGWLAGWLAEVAGLLAGCLSRCGLDGEGWLVGKLAAGCWLGG